MLRAAVSKLTTSLTAVGRPSLLASTISSRNHNHKVESPEEFDNRFIEYFNAASDGWIVRKGMTELHHHDVVADPKIINAALRACRRVNDYALAIRFLESVKLQCGDKVKEIYPWIVQEIRPVLSELGISTPEEMGYDQPELFLPDIHYWIPETDGKHVHKKADSHHH